MTREHNLNHCVCPLLYCWQWNTRYQPCTHVMFQQNGASIHHTLTVHSLIQIFWDGLVDKEQSCIPPIPPISPLVILGYGDYWMIGYFLVRDAQFPIFKNSLQRNLTFCIKITDTSFQVLKHVAHNHTTAKNVKDWKHHVSNQLSNIIMYLKWQMQSTRNLKQTPWNKQTIKKLTC